jgi:hypothetical protein
MCKKKKKEKEEVEKEGKRDMVKWQPKKNTCKAAE